MTQRIGSDTLFPFSIYEGGVIEIGLSEKQCVPCRGGVPALKGDEIARLLGQISVDWKVVDEHHLEREFLFPGFQKGLDFTVAVGEMAEAQGHHPDIFLAWGKVKLTVWTHKIDGLTESDFIFAAKAEQCLTKIS